MGATCVVQGARAQASTDVKAAVARVAHLMESGQMDAAESDATAAYRQFPNSGQLEEQLGEIAAARGQATAGESWLQKAIRDEKTDATPMLALARLYLEHPGQFANAETRARSLYERALRLDPGSNEANAELSLIAYRHEEYQIAAKHLNGMHGDAAATPFVEALQCGSSAALHRTGSAGDGCSLLLGNARTTEADALLAAQGLRAGERPQEIEKLLLAVQGRQKLSAAGLRLLGLAQDARGEHAEARATLERAFQQAPSDASLLVDLATVAQRQGKPQEALGYLAHARELQPRDAHIQAMFAQECAELGLLGEARNAMQAALLIEPENADYNLTMGKVTALSQDPLSAKPYLMKYHSLRPEDPHGTLLLGLIEFRAKEFELARPWLLEAAKSGETAAEANLYLGSGSRQLGELEEAGTFLQRSVLINGADPEAHAELGMLALQRHDLPSAERELARSVALDRDNYTANYGLLQLYAQTKDPRRPEQLKRFDAIKAQTDELNRQAMRVVEIRRDGEQGAPVSSANTVGSGPQ